MSRYQEKSDLPPLLVSRSDFRYPLETLVERPIEPRLCNQGFNLTMAQCNRVQRPPPPPHLIAQSKKSSTQSPHVETVSLGLAVDPSARVKQLEKSLVFVCESHSAILQSLHREVEELKKKNRELQFQMVCGKGSGKDAPESTPSMDVVDDPTLDSQKKIDKLEKEVRRLRSALRETLKINSQLTSQLGAAKHEGTTAPVTSLPDLSSKAQSDEVPIKALSTLDLRETDKQAEPSAGRVASPKLDGYSDSLSLIQQASSGRNRRPSTDIRRTEPRQHGGRGGEWVANADRGRRYSDFQPRLPRLALRHQNYQQQQQPQQLDAVQHYGARGADMLPVLKKPLFPVLDQQGERPPRKPRGNQRNRHGNNSQR